MKLNRIFIKLILKKSFKQQDMGFSPEKMPLRFLPPEMQKKFILTYTQPTQNNIIDVMEEQI